MPTYGVTTDGFVIKPLSAIRADVENYQRANVDPGLDFSDQSDISQINLPHISKLAELWELAQAVYNSEYPDSASGFSLDQTCALTGTRRSADSKTLVTGQVTLNPFKNLPAGSVANLTGQPNARFVTLTEVPAASGGGTFDVVFEAETAGATQVAAAQLSEIAEPVSGWTAVTNAAAGATGTATETDPDLRIKRETELEAQGSTNVDAIRADLSRVSGVVGVAVYENDTDVVDGVGRPPHSVHAILRGGTAADIGQALFGSKAAGIDTYGGTTETVQDSQGNDHDMDFDFATELVFYCDITVLTDPLLFDAVQGPIDIKANIAAYINALDVGADVIYDQIKCAAYDVLGVSKVTSCTIDFSASPTGTTDLVVDIDEFASSDVANINVTVT